MIAEDSADATRSGIAGRRIRDLGGSVSVMRRIAAGKGALASAKYWARARGGRVCIARDVIKIIPTGRSKEDKIKYLGDGYAVTFNDKEPRHIFLVAGSLAAKWGGWYKRP